MKLFLKQQKGSAALIVIILMALMMGLGMTYSVLTRSNSVNAKNYGIGIAAQNAAEAGVQFAMADAKRNIDRSKSTNWVWNYNALSGDHPVNDSGGNALATFNLTIKPNTLYKKGSSTNIDYEVVSIGKVRDSSGVEVQRKVVGFISVPSRGSPTLFELIESGTYSSGGSWQIYNNLNPPVARSPNSGYNYVAFNDQLDGFYEDEQTELKGFSFSYTINQTDIAKDSSGKYHFYDNGYGIIYLEQRDANNKLIAGSDYSGYVVQYDPGLDPPQIVVKKNVRGLGQELVTKESYNSGTTSYNDANAHGYSFQANTAKPTSWHTELVTDPLTGKKRLTYKMDMSKDVTLGGDISYMPFSTIFPKLDQFNQLRNQYYQQHSGDPDLVPLTPEEQKTDYRIDPDFKNTTNPMTKQNGMLQAKHTITIEAKPDSTKQYLIHSVSIDGMEVCRFIDREATVTLNSGKKVKNTAYTRGNSGLRTWSANVDFFNGDGWGQWHYYLRGWGEGYRTYTPK